MCGRFSLTEAVFELQKVFDFYFAEEEAPRYNIAPGQQILTIIEEEGARIGTKMKWGLVPYWSKEAKISYKMINARAEGIETKPSYKVPFKKRRCIILTDGFYEWKKTEEGKQPYRFTMNNGKPFAFAGLWDVWDKGEEPLKSCTIITTGPNEVTETIHDRMPVILKEKDYDFWLNSSEQDLEQLKSLMKPYDGGEMKRYPVSTLVNSSKFDTPDMIQKLNSL
ncbi:SOS response-associated peptidase [Cytobacillus purgationiresistens]|uniref:Abasic site processing protein n=1 Tax=Cytobacillus purgationiresistens TaxID=863449 RepID=A0ABU0AGG5_9BACI|nr:SOS response-associated peptidase [Cytobacillus purgationiresistens]MDQ0270357.1 putative SOS response-associated peptidase YedK [Cytobacillus purgationiresistens]